MITKYYEMACDNCGGGDYISTNLDVAIEHFKSVGWIFKNKKHFCTKDCEYIYENRNKNKTL